jgi:APA family basic amino acid/polyamine antiporter
MEAYLLPVAGNTVLPSNVLASAAILVAALAHGLQVRYGAVLQNFAVVIKLVLITGFIFFAVFASDSAQWSGVHAWQHQETTPLALPAFATTVMWISFSYSGFNAAVYIASEANDAPRLVPRALLVGTLVTMLIYLLLNAIFVFAPAPELIMNEEDVAAVAANALGGHLLETVMRGIIVIALFTSVSAMIMVGPRVYAQMAEDGLMPAWMDFQGPVPARATLAQALLAMVVVWLTDLRELLSYLGFTLGLCTAATIGCLFVMARRDPGATVDLPGYPWAPALFIAFTLFFAALAATLNPGEMLAAVLTIASAIIVYRFYGSRHQRIKPPGKRQGDT